MEPDLLPNCALDVLNVPAAQVPRTVRDLSREKRFSALIRCLNSDVESGDPIRRERATAALRHLGFTD